MGKRPGASTTYSSELVSSGWNPSYVEMVINETRLQLVWRRQSSSLLLLSVAFSREYSLQFKPLTVSSPFSNRVSLRSFL